jgi:hypothetical protein
MHSPDLGAIQISLARLSERSRDVAISFIYTELLTGLSSCRIIRNSQIIPERKKSWHYEYARKALHDAEAAMWRLKLSHPEFDQMMALAERLRFELDSLQRV